MEPGNKGDGTAATGAGVPAVKLTANGTCLLQVAGVWYPPAHLLPGINDDAPVCDLPTSLLTCCQGWSCCSK
jgi:hypothetical protein